MQVRSFLVSAGLVVSLASFGAAATGTAKIMSTADGSKSLGTVKLEDTRNGLKVSAAIENAPAGDHGFHIHEFGDCGDSGKSAGGHYNPRNVKHGNLMKDGMRMAHAGDMGNITIKSDGTGALEAVLPGITLTGGKEAVAGRAIILHEKADDFGQPVGNAGSRIGCGPILITAGAPTSK